MKTTDMTGPMARTQDKDQEQREASSFVDEVTAKSGDKGPEQLGSFIRIKDFLRQQKAKKPYGRPQPAKPFTLRWRAVKAYSKQKAEFQ